MKMSHSEAGKLGSIKSTVTWNKIRKENIEKYNECPSRCLDCNKAISYDKKTNRI